jgi:chromatin segregation and condensation protein Rec8/ScpA/Scc1 (kleisin family)|tara:strand:+ start:2138 stop:2326 length:189 start_codon:yes stop_codon:yes gene_type:complete
MAFDDKSVEELATEYTDDLIQYEEFLTIAEELFKKIELLKKKLPEVETELIKRGVEIKNVGS